MKIVKLYEIPGSDGLSSENSISLGYCTDEQEAKKASNKDGVI